jgi:hypothetical protein
MTTRQQVDAFVEDAFPSAASHITWIERDEPRRHVSVRFPRAGTVMGRGHR